MILQLFLFPSLNSQRISATQVKLIAGEFHCLASLHLLESHIALHIGPVLVSIVCLKTVAFPFLHLNSLLGLLGAGDSSRSDYKYKIR